jgi:hypothetical protein
LHIFRTKASKTGKGKTPVAIKGQTKSQQSKAAKKIGNKKQLFCCDTLICCQSDIIPADKILEF